MNKKSTQGSDLQKVDDEGKIFIIVVKPSLSLTLSWPVIVRLMKKRITLVKTFSWASEKWKVLVITVNDCWWSPWRGYQLFTTQYFRWDHFSFGALRRKSNIGDLIFSLVFNTKLIYWLNISFAQNICCCVIVCNSFNCFIDHNSQMARFLMWHISIVDYCVK